MTHDCPAPLHLVLSKGAALLFRANVTLAAKANNNKL